MLALVAQPSSAQSNLYLVALMGQSNMVGTGKLSELPPGFPSNPTKLWNFTNAYKWEPAREPVDSPSGQIDTVSLDKDPGVGPSLALADAFVSAHPSASVGLIPCAKGATTILDWQKKQTKEPRNTLFGSCMNRMKTVFPANGSVRAVIFWQGGADAKKLKNALNWKDRFTTFVRDLRTELGTPKLPILMVILEVHDQKAKKKLPYWKIVRDQQRPVNIAGVVRSTPMGTNARMMASISPRRDSSPLALYSGGYCLPRERPVLSKSRFHEREQRVLADFRASPHPSKSVLVQLNASWRIWMILSHSPHIHLQGSTELPRMARGMETMRRPMR